MNLSDWLWQTAQARPDNPAIRFGEDLHATYGQFARRSAAIGAALEHDFGIARGDRVALFAHNCAEYLEVLHGVLWIGAVIVPINFKLHPREAAWIIANAEAKLAITDEGDVFGGDIAIDCPELGVRSDALSPDLAETLPRPVVLDPDDLAWLFYTSGTTGRPKGVMASHRNLRAMAMAYCVDVEGITPDLNALYAAPMSHGAGLYNFQFIRGGACHVVPQSQGFDPAEIIQLAGSLGALSFFAAPTMVKRLITHAKAAGYHGEGIRSIVYGGGPMYVADIDEALAQFGPRFIQIYGQGESPMAITAMARDLVADGAHPRAALRRASVGQAQACVSVRIVDDDMHEMPVGETGEIVVAGDPVMQGYWRNAEATAKTLKHGWLRTGDMGMMDADGFVTLTDRSKDVIISGGTNIYPREVEEVLLAHEGIFEVSVIGAPDPDWGEVVIAFIVFREGADIAPAALDDWCRSQIASFKKPKRYEIVQSLPKNSYGKVLKTELRARIAGGQDQGRT